MTAVTSASEECPLLHLSGDELYADKILDDATMNAQHNNQLMALCGLTLRELVDAWKKRRRLLPSPRLQSDSARVLLTRAMWFGSRRAKAGKKTFYQLQDSVS